MKILHVTASAGGGAGIAARCSVDALREAGHNSELLTVDGDMRTHRQQLWRRRLDWAPQRLFYARRGFFSVWSNNWQPSRLSPIVNRRKPDLVHLHWLGDGSLHWNELADIKAPLVWTMHDTWAFTGGCHYTDNCKRYIEQCGACPQLGSTRVSDLSRYNLKRKRRYADQVARWISPSRWLGEMAVEGGTISRERLCVIPNGVNGGVFKRLEPDQARMRRNIPDHALVLVTGAVDFSEPRKGVRLLPEVLRRLEAMTKGKCVLILFGAVPERAADWPEGTCWTGPLKTAEEVAEVLGMADVFVLPSLQDNLPNVVLEALACGCPSVGFDAGGFGEIVETGVTGWVADRKDAEGLAEAIHHWLQAAPARKVVADRCRDRFESFYTLDRHAKALIALYGEVLGEGRKA